MLSFTRKAEYALIAMSHLASQQNGHVISARELAHEYDMPLPLLMNILKVLCQAGLVDSVRGARGGYRLTRTPERLPLLDIMQAVEGPLRLTECSDGRDVSPGICSVRDAGCPLTDMVQVLHQRIVNVLVETTLADLVEHRPATAGRSGTDRASLGLPPRA